MRRRRRSAAAEAAPAAAAGTGAARRRAAELEEQLEAERLPLLQADAQRSVLEEKLKEATTRQGELRRQRAAAASGGHPVGALPDELLFAILLSACADHGQRAELQRRFEAVARGRVRVRFRVS